MQSIIKAAIRKIVGPKVKFNVEHPENMSWGDYSTNVGIITHKPQEIVAKLKTEKNLKKIASKIEIAGAGFINISIQPEAIITQTDKLLNNSLISNIGNGKKVIVEYSSPNIAKPFTVGHLRSTVIGDAIANILEANGWQVLRDNHLGDWGTQFGKQIYALKKWGDVTRTDYSVKDLVALYVRFHGEAEKSPQLDQEARDWFKKLEDGDKEARELWQKCIDWSWVEFQKIYDLLGVKFSTEFDGGRGLGESFFEKKMSVVIDELKAKKLLKTGEDGAQLVFFKDDKYPPAMILKKDGTTLYATRDLATDKYRKVEYQPDLIINEVGQEQSLYFQQLFEMEKLLGWFKDGQRIHVGHGMYRFKDEKMSTRKGNVIWLEDVLDEAEKRAMVLQKTQTEIEGSEAVSHSLKHSPASRKHLLGLGKRMTLAREVGIGAIKWNDLKGSPKRNIIFDWDEILKMEGNSGPYLQYTYARANSVLIIAGKLKSVPKKVSLNPEEAILLRTLYRFEEVVSAAAEQLAPNLIANFIYDIAQKFNRFYNKHRVIGSGASEPFRLWLTNATAEIIKKGLNLLGITAPEKM